MHKVIYFNTFKAARNQAPILLSGALIATVASQLLQLLLMLNVSQAVSHLSTEGRLSSPQFWALIFLLIGVPLIGAGADLLIYRLQFAMQSVLQPAALHWELIHQKGNLTDEARSWVGQEGISLQFYVIQRRLGGLVSFLILAQWNVVLALLVALASWYSGHKTFSVAVRLQTQLAGKVDEAAMRSRFLWKALTTQQFAEETRLYGLAALLQRRLDEHVAARLESAHGDASRSWVQSFTANLPLVVAVGALCAWALSAHDVDYPGFLTAAVMALPGLAGLGNQGSVQIRANEFEDMVARACGSLREHTDAAPSEHPDLASPIVSFDEVSFAYREGAVIDNLSLQVHRGEKVAIVGSNGAGKSTLIKLLTGQHVPSIGRVSLNGVQPSPTHSLTGIGYVPQSYLCFPGSALDGILLGRGGDERRVLQASAWLGIEQLLNKPADHGDFSRGQWQRLAIARALVTPRKTWGRLLVLDEPTAALDITSERTLFRTVLSQTSPDDTVIIVTHRLDSIESADRIIVVDSGRIVQQGTHASLIAEADGLYARMYHAQHKLETGNLEPENEDTINVKRGEEAHSDGGTH